MDLNTLLKMMLIFFIRMYDFQVIRNVNIVNNVLTSDLEDGNKNKTNHFMIAERIRYLT